MSLPTSSSTGGASHPTAGAGGGLGPLRGDISNFFRSYFQQGQSGLTSPVGILGPAFQNLFGESPAGDFLGARGALQSTLSGAGLEDALNTAYSNLLPSTLKSIELGGAALRGAAGPNGLRFSTDLQGQQRELGANLLGSLQQNALNAAVPIFQQRAQSALGTYGLIGQLGQQNNPLALALQYATAFPGKGQVTAAGSRANSLS